jgi:hypothetical protein
MGSMPWRGSFDTRARLDGRSACVLVTRVEVMSSLGCRFRYQQGVLFPWVAPASVGACHIREQGILFATLLYQN